MVCENTQQGYPEKRFGHLISIPYLFVFECFIDDYPKITNTMKKLIFCAALIALGLMVTNPSWGQKQKLIPVTTKSEKALALYNDAMIAYNDYSLAKFIDLANQALHQDPDFFMANEQLAMYYIFYPVDKKFEEHAAMATSCKARLSKGELLMKDALAKLLEEQDADVTAAGKKLVELYPKDVYSYMNLSYYQFLIKDYNGVVETIKKAIDVTTKPGPYYNMLGYNYMLLGQFDDARIALDKYIELEPNNPNAYDSKGDYYMNIKDYQKAYESFMKANSINPNMDFQKAMNAKTLADSPLSDTETLAEMKAIRETVEEEIKASFSHDYARWNEYFVQEPFTLWQQAQKDGPLYGKGWNVINGYMEPSMEKAPLSKNTLNKCSGYIFRIYKDAALVSFTTGITHESEGVKMEVTGREVRSLEKKDGKWKIVYLGTVYTSTWDK